MQRSLNFSEGEYYHIYNRGVEKREIFSDCADYHRFILLLDIFNQKKPMSVRDFTEKFQPRGETSGKESLVDIGAYCLMPNHFHILVKETRAGGISAFMQKLTTGYTMYFNKRYERVGPLFQGAFKARHADTDEYLKYLYSYIHLNPIKLIQSDWKEYGVRDIEKAKKFLEKYQYSSYGDYHVGCAARSHIISKESFPEYFSEQNDFNGKIFDWLELENPEVRPRGNYQQNL